MSVRLSLTPLALLAAAAAALSCTDPTPVSVDPQGLALLKAGGTAHGLITCTPRPYDSATKVIGPEGGWLIAGGHVLVVDSLALSSPVSITAVAPSQAVNVVRFQPEGLKFNPGAHGFGAVVATNLDNCNVRPNQVLLIAHVSDALSILDFLPPVQVYDTVIVTKYQTALGSLWVGGLLQHFSNYAVAW